MLEFYFFKNLTVESDKSKTTLAVEWSMMCNYFSVILTQVLNETLKYVQYCGTYVYFVSVECKRRLDVSKFLENSVENSDNLEKKKNYLI